MTRGIDATADSAAGPTVVDLIDEVPGIAEPSAADGGPRARVSRTQIAVLAWVATVAVIVALGGVPTSRNVVVIIIVLGLAAASAGNPRSWARVVRDWLPLLLVLDAYDKLRAEADGWSRVHVTPQIDADRWLFGGQVPTVRLQHLLYASGHPHWYDYGVFAVYLSHFFVPLLVAALLWKFAYPRFRRFVMLFVALTFAAFATYAIYPAAPPWLASTEHALPATSKIIDQMWVAVGLHSGASVLSARGHLANPVAAIPSLHGAYPFLLMLFFWKSAGRWRWLLPLYPLAMGFTLVYSAEHYAVDIFLGWAYAIVVFCAGNFALDRWREYRTRRAALRELARIGGLSGGD